MPFDGVDTTGAALGILRYARAQIAAGHWCQHDWGTHGNHCALGWMHHASDGPGPETRMAITALNAAMPRRERVGPVAQTVIDYNDNHTQRGVVRLFDRAIATLERQQP